MYTYLNLQAFQNDFVIMKVCPILIILNIFNYLLFRKILCIFCMVIGTLSSHMCLKILVLFSLCIDKSYCFRKLAIHVRVCALLQNQNKLILISASIPFLRHNEKVLSLLRMKNTDLKHTSYSIQLIHATTYLIFEENNNKQLPYFKYFIEERLLSLSFKIHENAVNTCFG